MRYLFWALFFLSSAVSSAEPFSHALWDSVVTRWAHDSVFDYRSCKQDVDFWTYMDRLEDADTSHFASPEEREVFWINAYNASVVKMVLDRYPARTIKQAGLISPWERRRVKVGEEAYSFNEVRNILIGTFHDPRIHASLFMATKNSPALRVFHAESVASELDTAMRDFVSNKNNVILDRENNKASLSKIFDWYGKDFISGTATTLLQFIAPYVAEDDKSFTQTVPRILFLDFDWNLNDVQTRN